MKLKIQLLIVVSMCLMLLACATNPVTGESELQLLTVQDEINIGVKQYPQMIQMEGGEYTVYREVGAYVKRVGMKLAKVSDRPDLPYDFVVIDNSVPNAWALPGGKIAVNRGLLVNLNNEAELAAVLAHEIVHAAARHSAKQIEKGMWLNLGASGIASATGGGSTAEGALSLGTSIIQMNYSRGAELEADHYGMIYMSRAGYHPAAAVELQKTFLTLSEGGNNHWLSGLFASHPPTKERLHQNEQMVEKLAKGGMIGEAPFDNVIDKVKQVEPAYKAYSNGVRALSGGNMQMAMEYANQALDILPREARFYLLRGSAQQYEKNDTQALSDYTQAINLDSGYFLLYLKRGLLYANMGNRSAAQQDLKNSYLLLPTDVAQQALNQLRK